MRGHPAPRELWLKFFIGDLFCRQFEAIVKAIAFTFIQTIRLLNISFYLSNVYIYKFCKK